MRLNHLEAPTHIPMTYLPLEKGGRTWMLTEDIEVELSDGYWITLTAGTKTDLMSIPKNAWSIFAPFDKGLIGDLIHDWLWINKIGQIQHFGTIDKARWFADNERKVWRLALAPELKFKTKVTHWFIRTFGQSRYTGKKKIPI